MNLNYRKKNKITLIVALFVFLLLFILILAIDKSYFCSTDYLYKNTNVVIDLFCSRFVGEGILLPAWLFSGAIAIISFILLFLKEQVVNAWKKFEIIFIAISAAWIIIAPAGCGGGWAGFGGCVFDKETTAMFASAVFLIVSILIITVKSWKLRKQLN